LLSACFEYQIKNAATTNGIIIEIVMIARLAYGMARHRWLPGWFAALHPRTRIPLRATLSAGALIVVLALGFPFATLVAATSTVTLLIFIAVNHEMEPATSPCSTAPGKRSGTVQAQSTLTKNNAITKNTQINPIPAHASAMNPFLCILASPVADVVWTSGRVECIP